MKMVMIDETTLDAKVIDISIQIHAVSGNLEEPAVRFVPVTMPVVMPVVMRIVVLLLPVLVIRVLHLRQPC